MIDKLEQELNESAARCGTTNTNLAACIAALRIPVKKTDPIYVVEDAEHPEKGRTVTYFFEIESIPDGTGHKEQTQKVIWAWENWYKFKAENPAHSLVPMRTALEKYGWLTKVFYGQITPRRMPGAANFVTDNITLAACIMASGHELHSFGTRQDLLDLQDSGRVSSKSGKSCLGKDFCFRMPEGERDRIIGEFETFKNGTEPVRKMRLALECRALLIQTIKRAPIISRYINGDPDGGGKVGYICKDVPIQRLERFLEFMYE